MHASAHLSQEPDMFGGTEFAPPTLAELPAGPLIEFDGVLVRNAEIRTRPALDGLHSVPVVHVELKSAVYGVERYCSAEIPFTDATRHQAEILAKSLTKRSTVTITAPIGGMRVCLTHASIALHKEH